MVEDRFIQVVQGDHQLKHPIIIFEFEFVPKPFFENWD